MPITIRGSTDSRVGQVSAVLGGLSTSLEGLHTAPPNVVGRMLSSLGGIQASMRGQFAVPANRTGRIASTLGGLSASVRGAFIPESQFPLAVHASGRYLVDSSGDPFFLHGDTPWSLVAQLTNAQVDTYLNDRAAKGYTALLFNAIEHNFSSQTPKYLNVDGVAPFTTMTDYDSGMTAYWNRLDYIVNAAKALGIFVFINPSYWGFNGGAEGWFSEEQAQSNAELQAYGVMLAQRYTQGNVGWSLGGDYDGNQTARVKQWNIMTGIRSVRTTDIVMVHPLQGSGYPTWNNFSQSLYPGLNLNTVYTYGEAYVPLLTEYGRAGPIPVIGQEFIYENEQGVSAATLRRQAYQCLTNGACGQFFGNNPVWFLGSGWPTALNSTGYQQQAILKTFVDSFEWWKLAPSTGTALVTSSLGSGSARVCPTLASDGTFAWVWKPASGNVTVNMAALSGVPFVRARFFNPTDGTYSTVSGSPFTPSGSQVIAFPGERLLVLDEGAASTEWAGKTAHYVRQGASGNGSGNDWTNAYTALPATLTRDHVYYIADGSYSGYTFNDANSGSLKIYVVKATEADHGTDTGWISAYGDGIANFGALIFTTANWVFDGQVGGGPDRWMTGHGFKVAQTAAQPVISLGAYNAFSTAADNVKIAHTEIQGNENTSGGGSLGQDGIANSGSTGTHVTHCYIHHVGRCWFWFSFPDHLIEYNYLGVYRGTDAQHSEGFALYGDTGSDNTIRYNLMTHAESTGMCMWDNEDNSASILRFYGNIIYRAPGDSWLGGADVGNGILGSWAYPTEEQHNFLVYNNTFIDTDQTGGSNGTVKTLGGLATGTGNLVSNNYFYLIGSNVGGGGPWSTPTFNHFNATTAVGTNTSTSSGNPFVDSANLDFRLVSNTTSGTDLGAPYNVDMYGNTRTTWTRGAVEYVAP